MGVSYAAPAYYADRLCERGRCYLRDFLSPTKATRVKFDEQRSIYEDQKNLKALVDKQNKTQQDRDNIRLKKMNVDDQMKKYTWEQAKARFDAADRRDKKNCDALLETMYWM